jgi:hypothetical protein
MKESILLLLIGVVGVTGLVNIHREEKAEKELNLTLRTPGYWASEPLGFSEASPVGGSFQMYRVNGSVIRFKVDSFSPFDHYRLEFSDGETQSFYSGFTKRYTKPGIHIVKLFRNGDLIAIRNLKITYNDLQISRL